MDPMEEIIREMQERIAREAVELARQDAALAAVRERCDLERKKASGNA
jgi:hypothetical protein